MSVVYAKTLRLLVHGDRVRGRYWEVRRGFDAIGYIHQDQRTGRYKYFRGDQVHLRPPSYEALTLDQLKCKIASFG
jgi:hypothetical protein